MKNRRKYCIGCRNNFYNGNNDLGVKECWSFPEAKIVWKKEVHKDHVPPWNQKARRFFNCYHRSQYVYVDPKRTT